MTSIIIIIIRVTIVQSSNNFFSIHFIIIIHLLWWFWFDFIITIYFITLIDMFNNEWKWTKIISLLYFIRLLTFFSFWSIWQQSNEYNLNILWFHLWWSPNYGNKFYKSQKIFFIKTTHTLIYNQSSLSLLNFCPLYVDWKWEKKIN